MEIDTVKSPDKTILHIQDITPYACTSHDIRMEQTRLIDLVQRLRDAWKNSATRITDINLSIEHHCLAAIICYAMVRLARAEKYDALDAISAIALERADATSQVVVGAWDRANRSGVARSGVSSRIALEAALEIHREAMESKFDYGSLLAPCVHLPLGDIRNSLERAMRHTYQAAHNFLCRGGFDAEVVLAVHLVEQLERLGYEPGLVLRAVAVEDVWDLLNTGDISADEAWNSALKDNGRMAEERVQNAKTQRFVAAMDHLQMEDEPMDSSEIKRPSHAWVGLLGDSRLAVDEPSQVTRSGWITSAVYGEDLANIDRGVGNMDLEQNGGGMRQVTDRKGTGDEVSDEELREFERMLE